MTKKFKVMTIFGTRPEAIKMAPLVLELEKHPEEIESIVTVTAQHRQMLDQVLETFDITPNYDLNIMKDRQTLVDVATNALLGLDRVMKEAKPDIVLVHGDTATTFVGSLAAFYNQIAIGHVEAGLRTGQKYSPYPEEMNRQLTGVMADLHFAPTEQSRANLLKENKLDESIFVTGNTAIDALKTTVSENYTHPVLEKIGTDRMILLTAHRRENLGNPMRNMFRAIMRLLNEHTDIQVVYPVHMNPAVREVANEILGDNPRVHLIEPLEVFDFHNFAARSYMILTDSGGVQEEAPSLGKPVLVLRDTTERPEGIAAGTLKLAGTDEEVIYSMAKELLTNNKAYEAMAHASNPYGDGFASARIVEALLKFAQKQLLEDIIKNAETR
ncbi:non-hydrolyzing UDP-N-acetylglucosamine 2-epimerase [Solibacillus sp. FSL K6-4121]|uniref:non-hydrolyzing UDP-N-acetylglucosamine 2-epimerase n=1 Tax=Solibacillus sp. FSL K6-4121 TaxID=2921505 RepID=UPI0030F4CC58